MRGDEVWEVAAQRIPTGVFPPGHQSLGAADFLGDEFRIPHRGMVLT